MPMIYEDALKKDISSGCFAPIYLLFGDDTYLKQHYASLISEKAFGGDPFFNLVCFDGDVDLQEVYDAVTQYPMMADTKCVVVTDFDFEHADLAESKRLNSLMDEVPAGCTLVIRFDSVEFDSKRSSRAKSLMEAVEKRGGKNVCLDHRKPAALVKMLVAGAKKYNCILADNTARYIVETVGDDIILLKNELYKLCSYCEEGGTIDKAMVDYVCVKSIDASIYDFAKLIFNCDITSALKMLDDMFFMRFEPIAILSTVTSAFVDVYRVFVGSKSGVSTSQISSDFGYGKRAFLLDRARGNIGKFDEKKLKRCFEELVGADTSLKSSGSNARTVLEELTVRLVYIIGER